MPDSPALQAFLRAARTLARELEESHGGQTNMLAFGAGLLEEAGYSDEAAELRKRLGDSTLPASERSELVEALRRRGSPNPEGLVCAIEQDGPISEHIFDATDAARGRDGHERREVDAARRMNLGVLKLRNRVRDELSPMVRGSADPGSFFGALQHLGEAAIHLERFAESLSPRPAGPPEKLETATLALLAVQICRRHGIPVSGDEDGPAVALYRAILAKEGRRIQYLAAARRIRKAIATLDP